MKRRDEGQGYDPDSIKILDGLAPVRKRPGAVGAAVRAKQWADRRAALDERNRPVSSKQGSGSQ